MGRGRNVLGVGAGALLLAAGTTAAAYAVQDCWIGPDRNRLRNGRQIDPAGKLVKLGNFPTGGALTPDGRYYWTLSTGRGINDIRIVSVEDAKVIQKIVMPGLSGGIAMDPNSRRVYVSGL